MDFIIEQSESNLFWPGEQIEGLLKRLELKKRNQNVKNTQTIYSYHFINLVENANDH